MELNRAQVIFLHIHELEKETTCELRSNCESYCGQQLHKKSLKFKCMLDKNEYPKGIKSQICPRQAQFLLSARPFRLQLRLPGLPERSG